jgi:hypothetical protein
VDLRERKREMENIKYENPDNLYPQPVFGRVTKSRRMRQPGHATRIAKQNPLD